MKVHSMYERQERSNKFPFGFGENVIIIDYNGAFLRYSYTWRILCACSMLLRSHSYKMISRSYKIGSRSYEIHIVSRNHEIVSRIYEIVPRNYEIAYEVRSVLFVPNDFLPINV